MLRSLAAILVFSSIAAACAFNSSGAAVAMGAPRGRPCTVPEAVPVSATSFLVGPFRAPSALLNGAPDTLLLVVQYDSSGTFESLILTSRTNRQYDLVRDSGGEPPPAAARFPGFDGPAIYRELRTRFVDRAPPGAIGTSLIATNGGGELLPNPVSFECPPVLLNAGSLQPFMNAVSERHSRAIQNRTVTMIRLMVEADGNVTNPRIMRTSGDPEVDAALVSIAELAQFEPANHHGYPIRVPVSVPFTLAPPREVSSQN